MGNGAATMARTIPKVEIQNDEGRVGSGIRPAIGHPGRPIRLLEVPFMRRLAMLPALLAALTLAACGGSATPSPAASQPAAPSAAESAAGGGGGGAACAAAPAGATA